MLRVGLTGGIASGKSVISGMLKDLGASILDADHIAHEVIRPHTPAHQEIVDHFGQEILLPDGSIDRPQLGRLVFEDAAKRALLERIVHPRVFSAEESAFRKVIEKNPQAVVIFEAALLIETQANERMDKIIVVYADEETQIKRMIERDRLDVEEIKKRIAAQAPFSEKKPLADYIIDGTAPLSQVAQQIETIFQELKALAEAS